MNLKNINYSILKTTDVHLKCDSIKKNFIRVLKVNNATNVILGITLFIDINSVITFT